MHLHVIDAGEGQVQIKAVGPFIVDAPEQLGERLIALVGPQVYETKVQLDLEESEFISSAGIGGLLHCHKRFQEHGGELCLASPSRTIRQTLDLMRLQTVLQIV